jgi:16S rRNA C967 or C1407 C5-methylase (RsmB/RsmF family)
MADKVIELLRLMEKFGVKPGKIIGAGDRKVTPIKKPILSKQLNRDYLLEDVKEEKIGINTVKNEIEDIAPLFFQKKLNDVEINNLLNNLTYLDKLLNPTNILDITTKAPVKGLESLKPISITGGLEKAGKQLEEVGKKLEETTKPKSVIGEIMSDYASFQKIMQEENKKGLVRATTRSILYQDIKDGKIKGMTFEQLGSAKDPIEDFRKIYGEDALEQLNTLTDDFSQMRTPEEAANFAKTRFKFEPRKSDLPETTTIEEAKKAEQEFGINKPAKVTDFKEEATKRTSIDDLIDEYNANQDRLRLSDEEGGTAISYDEFRKLQDRNRQIADALENKGISSKIEEEVKPEGIVIPFKKKITEPEEFADGGITRTKFATGGKGKKILDIIKKANKDLKGKKSMETVNPKTGEVTVADEFVTTSEQQLNKKRQLTKEEIEDYEEAIGRNSEEWMSEGTVEEAENALKRSKAEEAYYLQQYKTGQLDPPPGEKSQSRMRFLQKKAEEAADVKDKRLFSLDESDELDELERTFNKKNTSAGGFDFNDPEIKAQMEKAMQEGNKRSKEMRAMGLDPAKSKDYDEYIKIKEKSGDKNFNKYFDDLEIKTKFKGVISDDLLNQILIDDNPQRKAEVIATIEQGLKMQEKGMDPQEIVDILKNTTRTKQAKGGSVGLNYLMGF